jgi:iron complex outermembrane recepter protein
MRLTNTLLTSVALFAIATPAFAQDTAPADTTEATPEEGEQIIVTAGKRETTLQDTPIAVSVTSAVAIERAQVRDLLDIQTLVPSLRVGQLQSSANTNFIIRGFGNGANNAGIEPSVGVFIDGVYRSRSASQIGDLPDVQRVEVLRGPQSTLFGKNASAGIISIVTKEPQFTFGGSAELSYGNFNAIVARANITGPLSETIAFSIGGNFNKRDGYSTDVVRLTDQNERNRWGVRGSILFEPSNDFKLRLIADYDKIDENCCAVVNVVDGPTGNAVRALGGRVISNAPLTFDSATNFDSTNVIENYGFSGQADYSTGDLKFTAIGAYRAVRSDTNQDSDFTSADLIGFNGNVTSIDTYTFEARVASDFDGPLNFLLGGFYFKEDIGIASSLRFGRDFRNYANLLSGGGYISNEATLRALNGIPATVPAFGSQGLGVFENYDYGNNAYSAFGQVDFEITNGVTLTLGGNYTDDKKAVVTNVSTTDTFSTIDLVQTGANAGLPGTIPAGSFGPGQTAAIFPRTNSCSTVTAAPPATAGNPTRSGSCNPFLAFAPLQFLPGFANYPNAVENGKFNSSKFSYTIRLSVEVTDNINVYATYATGFKAASVNLTRDSRPAPAIFTPGSPAQVPAPAASPLRTALGAALPNNLTTGSRFANPEEATVMEIGLKAQFPGLSFNLSIFDQKLEGFQSNIFTGTGFVLGNAPEQSVLGFEMDALITPTRGLNFTAAVTYLDAEFDSFPGASSLVPGSFAVVPTDLTGLRPSNLPEWSISVGMNYTVAIGSADLIFATDYNHTSAVFIAQGLNFKRDTENLSATMTVALDNGLSVSVWGRNLTDDAYITTLFPAVAQAGSLSGYRNQPRTYGVSAKFKF